MKFSENWLREWVSPELDSTALAEQLSMAGLEVDAVEPVAGEFTGVVIGEVKECGQHPNADKLRVTKVDVGGDELLDIVCGAPNCRLGIKVAVAVIGAVLPGNFKIKKTKLRGEPSNGMLCSASELELNDDHDGILELPSDAPIGTDFREWMNLDDKTLDVDLTPNRADCLGIRGIAREVGVLNNLDVAEPRVNDNKATIRDTLAIQLDAKEACSRYLGRVIKNIDMNAKTPLWMVEKLRRSGIRSIDPVVDITNFVLLELGHPMHAFDFDTLKGGIQVRFAKENESLKTLDGEVVELSDDVLVIADQEKALAIAGIFGGEASGVTEKTRHIFLESAYFNPEFIMGKARRFGLHTDASHRYERGVDPELQRIAMERATSLVLSICGGEAGPITEAKDTNFLPQTKNVTLRNSRLSKVLGIELDPQKVTEILQRLGFSTKFDDNEWSVKVPPYRFDIAIEEDLIEEVARVYGYNNIPSVAPTAELKMTRQEESVTPLNELQQRLLDQGYQEAITYSFVDPKHQALLYPESAALNLPHPISVDMSSMRLGLLPALLSAAGYNQKRQHSSVKLFETGLKFTPQEDAENGISQVSVIGGVVYGPVYGEHWQQGSKPTDFFTVKGHVESLLKAHGFLSDYRFVASEHSALHPGQSAAIYKDGQYIGFVGALHPQFEKTFGLKSRTFVFELELTPILERNIPVAKSISKFPSIRRDLALVVDKNLAAGELLESVKKVGANHVVDLHLFDVYQGDNLPSDKKSLALALILRAEDRTLEEQDVNESVATVVDLLKQEFNAVLRDS
ncbi:MULTISPECIES: phenylalanine--tRNA ligase subunit beta [Gammaproteobacteria]|uniref:phenylalanine--tRNA ligase subunit beta n=1 Tax=Gammaproteobacteria TaxID=1236 RepID=UPI000DD09682|nr:MULTISPECIES: phenylalanine--tRNA ligase subunit beta [Gammaproteobacteria]RTE87329.1 phenylalanine--tRNA ligase subunit beta [Aliidiomarina sp. B3213]TCZ92885.1 phenylalanine--tRNA ligase subunit beta [Lysobacter sp. N42]